MPLQSSESPLVRPATHALDDGPVLECSPVGSDTTDQSLRIRARRLYPVSRDELYAAWTRRTAWDSWMRLRARSRATLAPYRGGAFRLELAEGPTIHVITGEVNDLRPAESLSLSWVHHTKSEHTSTIDVAFRDCHGLTECSVVHSHIANRREASWLMRLWSTVLERLGTYLAEGSTASTRRVADVTATIANATEPEIRRSRIAAAFARSAAIALVAGTIALGGAQAQAPTDSSHAAGHYFAGRWSQSAQAYAALARADTTSILNWYRYGVSLEELGQYRESLDALRHATRARPPLSNQIHYRLAKAHAGLGAPDSAIAQLDEAAGGGLRLWETVKTDADFAPVRSDARFARVLSRIENNRFPCRQTAENRQLDFWVGEWTVVNGSTLLGTNTIERVNGECMLQENWLSNGSGGGGKSWSYYDPNVRKWKQLFIFDNGAVTEFTGELHEGTMRFETPVRATATSPAGISRMTFFPIAKDSVRQLFQISTDGGKTWSAGFDGMYVRKPGTAR